RGDREALHCIADGGHADGEAVVAAGLAVVAVPHLEVEVALSGVLDPRLAAPMHGTIRAARVRLDLRKGDFRGVEVKWMPIDLHLGSVVDPLQGALVREADAVRILLTGPHDVGPEGLVLMAGRRVLLGLFRWVIDPAAARDLDRHAYEVPRLKVRQRLADPRCHRARLPVAARRNQHDRDGHRQHREGSQFEHDARLRDCWFAATPSTAPDNSQGECQEVGATDVVAPRGARHCRHARAAFFTHQFRAVASLRLHEKRARAVARARRLRWGRVRQRERPTASSAFTSPAPTSNTAYPAIGSAVCTRRSRTWSGRSLPPARSCISATTPVTCGVAMLVPLAQV